jgi:hypothetical protein
MPWLPCSSLETPKQQKLDTRISPTIKAIWLGMAYTFGHFGEVFHVNKEILNTPLAFWKGSCVADMNSFQE